MERPDGWIAPVRYLPGVPQPSAPPAFANIYDDDSAVDDRTIGTGANDGPDAEDELSQRDRAENVSMRALTRRGISRRELERTLRGRDLDDSVVDYELDRLERVGLIDDIALAQNLVGTLQERKGLGRQGIAAELTRRLLAPAAIEYALELVDSGDELARAREVAEKRARQLGGLDREVAARRLSAFLARRGYGGSTVRAAVDHALAPPSRGSNVRFR